MEFINITPLAGMGFTKLGPLGRRWHVVVVRGSFRLGEHEGELRLLDGEHALSLEDTYHGDDPLTSALRHETDLVWTKPACDLIIAGHAHAPGGRPQTRWDCAVRLDQRTHKLSLTGPRHWHKRWSGWQLSQPEATARVPLDYALAFGGDPTLGRKERPGPWPHNPVGVGWYRSSALAADRHYPAPQFEVLGQPYRAFDRRYPVCGFSPLSRWWPQRCRHAGTFDKAWERRGELWLPDDFNTHFYNGAPSPLQMPHPQPGARLAMIGIWPTTRADGLVAMRLPAGFPEAEIYRHDGPPIDRTLTLDTVLVEPDAHQIHLSWRLSVPVDLQPVLCCVRWPHWLQRFVRDEREAQAPQPVPIAACPLTTQEAQHG